MYRFKITIGHYGLDTQRKSKDFVVRSNKPVQAVREAHYEIKNKTGIDIEGICSDYGENEIEDATVHDLENLGFAFADGSGRGKGFVGIDEMARIWLFLLQEADPGLELEIEDDDIEYLQFFGTDEKGRHIGTIGYGLFP